MGWGHSWTNKVVLCLQFLGGAKGHMFILRPLKLCPTRTQKLCFLHFTHISQWGIMKKAAFDSRMCACLARLPGLAGSVTLLTGPKRAKVSLTASSHNAGFMVGACTCVRLTLTGGNLSAIGTGECPLIFAEMFICSPKVGLNLTA